jgi:zinc transport system permease protein
LLAVGLHNKLLAVCFDQEFTELRGVRVKLLYLMLLCLTALTAVLLVRVVGIVLVIALLTLPAAAAGQFSRRLGQMMVLASALSMGFTACGLGVSYTYNLRAGPTIILLAGGVYLAAVAGGRLRGRGAA